jgi:hypothetical protein
MRREEAEDFAETFASGVHLSVCLNSHGRQRDYKINELTRRKERMNKPSFFHRSCISLRFSLVVVVFVLLHWTLSLSLSLSCDVTQVTSSSQVIFVWLPFVFFLPFFFAQRQTNIGLSLLIIFNNHGSL